MRARERQANRSLVAILTCAVLVIATAVLAGGSWDGPGRVASIVIAVAVCVAGVASYANDRPAAPIREGDAMATLALTSASLALVTITWNGIRVAPGLALCDVFLVATALIVVIRASAGHRSSLVVPGWAIVPGYVLLSTGLVYALYAGGIIADAVPALRFAIALTLTPIVLAASSDTLRHRETLVAAWLLGAVINCSAAFSDFIGVTELGKWIVGGDYARVGRFNGASLHPNHLAIAAAMALPVALSQLTRSSPTRRGYVIYSSWAAMLALGILLSGSRAGLVVGVVAAVAIVLVPRRDARSRLRVLLFLASGLMILVIAGSSLAGRGNLFIGADRILQPTGGEQASNAGRRASFAAAVSDFGAHPLLGTGFSEARSAVNIYLQLLQAGGVLAFAAFTAAVGGALRACIGLVRDTLLSSDDRHMAAALAIALTAWLAFGLFQNTIYDRFLYVPAGLTLAILGAARCRHVVGTVPDRPAGRQRA